MKKRYRGLTYKEDYVSFWNKKGDYGKNRVKAMRQRKQKRFEKWYEKRKRDSGRPFYDKSGRLMKVCDYQPMGSFSTSYCEYPCNGDC
jgi:hypothetical protein